jgi:RNA polymerase sigma-70 factor (ECF subfamily)
VQEERRARFEALVDLVGEPLRRYTVRRLGPDAADDALAEVFVVLWRRLDNVPPEAELPWCYGVARNCVANEQRGARRRAGLLDRVARLSPRQPFAEPELPDPALHAALAGMREQDRELVRLWAWEDLTPAEIAVVLGTTANAVSIRLHRARTRLAALLGVEGKDPAARGQEQVEGGRTP